MMVVVVVVIIFMHTDQHRCHPIPSTICCYCYCYCYCSCHLYCYCYRCCIRYCHHCHHNVIVVAAVLLLLSLSSSLSFFFLILVSLLYSHVTLFIIIWFQLEREEINFVRRIVCVLNMTGRPSIRIHTYRLPLRPLSRQLEWFVLYCPLFVPSLSVFLFFLELIYIDSKAVGNLIVRACM